VVVNGSRKIKRSHIKAEIWHQYFFRADQFLRQQGFHNIGHRSWSTEEMWSRFDVLLRKVSKWTTHQRENGPCAKFAMIRQRSPHWLSFSAVVFLHVERAGFLYRVMRVIEASHLVFTGSEEWRSCQRQRAWLYKNGGEGVQVFGLLRKVATRGLYDSIAK